MAGANIMEIGYAIQVKPKDDPFIRYAESALECFNAAAVGGTFLVDVLPICESVVASSQSELRLRCVSRSAVRSCVGPGCGVPVDSRTVARGVVEAAERRPR